MRDTYVQNKECWKRTFRHTPTFSIEPLFAPGQKVRNKIWKLFKIKYP